jgi:hypothetical protein
MTSKQKTQIRVLDSDEEKKTATERENLIKNDDGIGGPDFENKSEFVTLKEIEGKLLSHHLTQEKEREDQRVHFKIDLNDMQNPKLKPHPNNLPQKSALKSKGVKKIFKDEETKLKDIVELGKKDIITT